MDGSNFITASATRRSVARATRLAHVAVAEGREILAAVRRPDINLALWTRELPPPVARLARDELSRRDVHISLEANVGDVVEALAAAMGDAAAIRGASLWIEDVHHLARLFAWATGARRLHLHVEALHHDACRFFHVDNVRCRLITSYAGPGTQWLADPDVVRDALAHDDAASVRRPGARVRFMRTGWVGLFKGERLRGTEGRGIVHRSPPIRAAGRRRLVLKIGYAGEIACD